MVAQMVKNLPTMQQTPWIGKIPWRRKWQSWGSRTRQSVKGSKSRNWWCSPWPSVLRERSRDGKCSPSWWLLLSCSVVFDSLWPHRLPCPSQSPGICSNSCPLNWRCHPTISSSVTPFSSCLQSFQASGSFQWVSSSHQVAKVLELQPQHQSFSEYSGLISFRIWLV